MKKITFLLTLLLTVSISFAQFNGAGKYRLKNNKYPVYLSHDGTVATTVASAGDGSSTDTTIFDFVTIGSDTYDIVVNTGNENLRANSTTAIELRAWDGNKSTSAPEIWTVSASGTADVFNIYTPETSSERFLVVQTDGTSVGYSGSDFTRTQWIVEPLNPLSNEEFDLGAFFMSNLVNEELIIKGIPSNVKNVSVYSLLGQELLSKEVKSEALRVDISTLKSGIYIVDFSGENGRFAKKIIKK